MTFLAQVNINGVQSALMCDPGPDLYALSTQANIAAIALCVYILALIVVFIFAYLQSNKISKFSKSPDNQTQENKTKAILLSKRKRVLLIIGLIMLVLLPAVMYTKYYLSRSYDEQIQTLHDEGCYGY